MFEVKIMSILTETHMYAQVKEYITHDKLQMQLLYFQKKGKRKRLTLTGKKQILMPVYVNMLLLGYSM